MAFSNETFSDESYGIASSTADRINGTFIQKTQGENGCDIIDIEDALVFDERLIYVTYKPSKKTLLHYYMKNYFIAEFNYLRRKTDLSFPEYIFPLLNELKVKYNNNTTNSYEEYNYYLYNLLINNCDKYINEAFNILFEDRNLMKNFSISVSKLIQKIKKQHYPKFLAEDGKIKRDLLKEKIIMIKKPDIEDIFKNRILSSLEKIDNENNNEQEQIIEEIIEGDDMIDNIN